MMNKIAPVFSTLAALAFAGCGGSKSNTDNVSQVEHTAPVGMWGGALVSSAATPVTLTLTTGGGHFVFVCGQTADMTQEVVPDSSGHFSVAGSTASGGPPSPSPLVQPAQFSGTVTNHVMTVTLKISPASGTPYTDGPYAVTLGQTAPPFQGACPG